MVEDRVTDGRRIGQLLASELDGRETGSLDRFAVVDADRDAVPSPAGTEAYTVTLDEERVARVLLFPGAVGVEMAGDVTARAPAVREAALERGLAVRTENPLTVEVPSGAAVKRAVDALAGGLTGT